MTYGLWTFVTRYSPLFWTVRTSFSSLRLSEPGAPFSQSGYSDTRLVGGSSRQGGHEDKVSNRPGARLDMEWSPAEMVSVRSKDQMLSSAPVESPKRSSFVTPEAVGQAEEQVRRGLRAVLDVAAGRQRAAAARRRG